MRIETMIYLYGAVCVSMIAFNIIYSLILRVGQPRQKKLRRVLAVKIRRQMGLLRQGKNVESKHLEDLQHTLRRTSKLIAFDYALREVLEEEQEPWSTRYVDQIQPAILYLALVYQKRDNMSAAYFSYILSRYMAPRHMPIHSIQGVLLDYIRKDNLYCRVNGMQALYRFGSVENILTALEILDRGDIFVHEKILTEGLLTFTGDHSELMGRLWERLDRFSEHTQIAISNYIRFQTGAYTEEMMAVMLDEGQGKELRLSAIRYFGRYYYEPALEPLLAFVRQTDPEQWEYVTISASALARYPGGRTLDALKDALHSSNWYVRYAAAASLDALGAEYEDLLDVISSNDRYAREMVMYRLESRWMQKEGALES